MHHALQRRLLNQRAADTQKSLRTEALAFGLVNLGYRHRLKVCHTPDFQGWVKPNQTSRELSAWAFSLQPLDLESRLLVSIRTKLMLCLVSLHGALRRAKCVKHFGDCTY